MFFNDILVYTKSWVEHLEHLKIVFSILKNRQLHVKLEKCESGQTKIKYLGHVISKEGVDVDPPKIEVMLSWLKPHTSKAVRGLLELTGYYRKSIPNYGRIAAPLTNMLKKDSFEWSGQAEEAFQKLKLAMTHTSVLALPNFNRICV